MSITLGFTYNAQRLKDAVKDAESLGFNVMSAPSVGIDPGDESAFSTFESALGKDVAVIFTSTESVEESVKRFSTKLNTLLAQCKVFVTDPSASRALAKNGFTSAIVSSDLSADVKGSKVVLAGPMEETGPIARSIQGDVTECAVCKLRDVGMGNGMFHMMIAIKRGRMDVLALTSPSSASDFMNSMKSQYGDEKAESYMGSIKVVAMDEATADRLRGLGRSPDMVSDKGTFQGMLQDIKSAFL